MHKNCKIYILSSFEAINSIKIWCFNVATNVSTNYDRIYASALQMLRLCNCKNNRLIPPVN